MIAIIGITLENRIDEAVKFQEIITGYGCYIRTRIGLHPVGEYSCTNHGIILLEVTDKVNEIYDVLSRRYSVQIMKF